MKGLLIKDLLQLKKEFKPFYLLLVLLPAIGGLNNPLFFLPIFTIIGALYWGTFVLIGLGKEETYRWRETSFSFPLSIKQLVIEKYLFSLGLGLCSIVTVFFVGLGASLFLPLTIRSVIFYAILAGIMESCFCILVIPISYRFGADSCRYFIFAFAGLPGIAAMAAKYFEFDYVTFFAKMSFTKMQLFLVVALLLVLFFLISIFSSLKVYRRPAR